jgi:peroxiredoxin
MKTAALLLAAVVTLPLAAQAQKESGPSSRPPTEPRVVAPPSPRKSSPILGSVAVGDLAPTFVLDGSRGRPVKLTSLRGNWLLLAFADRWQQLKPLDQIDEELTLIGAQTVGVCHEKAQTLINLAERDTIPILMLADVTGEVSSLYGLFDPQRGEARPGFLLIDRKGVVQMALLGQLPPPDAIARLARFAITGL